MKHGTKRAGSISKRPERGIEDAIKIMWMVVDEAKMYLEDEKIIAEEKRRWAKTIADDIAVLNKLLTSKKEKTLEDEDLGSLLFKVPKRFKSDIIRRVSYWRKRSF